MHDFKSDFYGQRISVVVLGYIRPELDYTSRGLQLLNWAQTELMLACCFR